MIGLPPNSNRRTYHPVGFGPERESAGARVRSRRWRHRFALFAWREVALVKHVAGFGPLGGRECMSLLLDGLEPLGESHARPLCMPIAEWS